MSGRIGWIVFGLLALAIVVTAALVVGADGRGAFREARVERRTIAPVVRAPGRTESAIEVDLSARTFGRVREVRVEEGQAVAAGEVVAVFENDDLQAAAAAAEASLEGARARLDEVRRGARPEERDAARARVERAAAERAWAEVSRERAVEMQKSGTVSQERVDEAEAQRDAAVAREAEARAGLALVEAGSSAEQIRAAEAAAAAAEAALAQARAALDMTIVRSPIAGRVIRRRMDPGEAVSLERPEPIVTIADMARIRVRVEVDESDLRKVRAGLPAVVTSGSFPGQAWPARVAEVASIVGRKRLLSDDPREMVDRKVLEARVAFDAAVDLPLNLPVDVEIRDAPREGVPAIPREAVHWLGPRARVLVPGSPAPAERYLEIGAEDGAFVEVRAGLSEGDPFLLPAPPRD